MQSLSVFRKFPLLQGAILFAGILFLSACSSDNGGMINMTLIHPNGGHCSYDISEVPVTGLYDVNSLRGVIGRVVQSPANLSTQKDILDSGIGFTGLDVQFSQSGNNYGPLDYTTLFGASIWYSIKLGYDLFVSLAPETDLAAIVPDLADTAIVYRAQRYQNDDADSAKEVYDNASYRAHVVETPDGGWAVKNYFFTYPTKEYQSVPLGLNFGVMVHEYTHMQFQHLFTQKLWKAGGNYAGESSRRAMSALNEGLADYFGYLATKDAGWFDCSLPNSNRDLSVPKYYNSYISTGIDTGEGYDEHDGGAVWAAIQYQIGLKIGAENNGRALALMMLNLYQCLGGGTSISASFSQFASCHMQAADGRYQSAISSVYSTYLGSGR